VRHALRQPGRHMSVVQWKISGTGTLHMDLITGCLNGLFKVRENNSVFSMRFGSLRRKRIPAATGNL
jgi:hypothetical protein